ncbi:MAG: hypothetical protein J6C19_03140 [Lachnospiraceae bacterium]|nr:hypothetical protein [Lachnospiraceae bacterium]
MGYCNGMCPHLDKKKCKCIKTGEKLGYIKGWWGTTYEHRGFPDCDKNEDLGDGRNNITPMSP